MSSCFAYGLASGKPIAELARQRLAVAGRADLWQNLPVLIVVVLGGFTTNFLWCAFLILKNRVAGQFVQGKTPILGEPVPLYLNYVLAAIAGVTWYFQFFFYSMGQTRMGKYDFSSWTLHMASIIIFSTLWGVSFKEWRGTSRPTRFLVGLGVATLVFATIVVGYGNYLQAMSNG
jgi:L-rhamnose-H+ transport protein